MLFEHLNWDEIFLTPLVWVFELSPIKAPSLKFFIEDWFLYPILCEISFFTVISGRKRQLFWYCGWVAKSFFYFLKDFSVYSNVYLGTAYLNTDLIAVSMSPCAMPALHRTRRGCSLILTGFFIYSRHVYSI